MLWNSNPSEEDMDILSVSESDMEDAIRNESAADEDRALHDSDNSTLSDNDESELSPLPARWASRGPMDDMSDDDFDHRSVYINPSLPESGLKCPNTLSPIEFICKSDFDVIRLTDDEDDSLTTTASPVTSPNRDAAQQQNNKDGTRHTQMSGGDSDKSGDNSVDSSAISSRGSQSFIRSDKKAKSKKTKSKKPNTMSIDLGAIKPVQNQNRSQSQSQNQNQNQNQNQKQGQNKIQMFNPSTANGYGTDKSTGLRIPPMSEILQDRRVVPENMKPALRALCGVVPVDVELVTPRRDVPRALRHIILTGEYTPATQRFVMAIYRHLPNVVFSWADVSENEAFVIKAPANCTEFESSTKRIARHKYIQTVFLHIVSTEAAEREARAQGKKVLRLTAASTDSAKSQAAKDKVNKEFDDYSDQLDIWFGYATLSRIVPTMSEKMMRQISDTGKLSIVSAVTIFILLAMAYFQQVTETATALETTAPSNSVVSSHFEKAISGVQSVLKRDVSLCSEFIRSMRAADTKCADLLRRWAFGVKNAEKMATEAYVYTGQVFESQALEQHVPVRAVSSALAYNLKEFYEWLMQVFERPYYLAAEKVSEWWAYASGKAHLVASP